MVYPINMAKFSSVFCCSLFALAFVACETKTKRPVAEFDGSIDNDTQLNSDSNINSDAPIVDASNDRNMTTDTVSSDTNISTDAPIQHWFLDEMLSVPMGVEQYGMSLAISADGNTIVVGAPGNGAVSVYSRSGSTWSGAQALARPVGFETFGWSVAIDGAGTRIVVGGYESGMLSVFTKSGSTWSAGAPLQAFGSVGLGWSVDISSDGNTIVASASNNDPMNNGQAAIYQFNGSVWSTPVLLAQPNLASSFGSCVSISGNGTHVVVGDIEGGNGQRGAASVYAFADNAWTGPVVLNPPADSFSFGSSCDLSEDGHTLVVGDRDGSTSSFGAALVYAFEAGAWSALPRSLGRPVASSRFGWSVAVSSDGNRIAVGDHNSRSVSVYERAGGTWFTREVITRDASEITWGWDVSLNQSGTQLVIGDPGITPFGMSLHMGTVSIYEYR